MFVAGFIGTTLLFFIAMFVLVGVLIGWLLRR